MEHPRSSSWAVLALSSLVFAGCWSILPSHGGGQTSFDGSRTTDPADIALPDGYRAEVVAAGLTFPTSVTFDERGGIYVLEAGYSYGEVWTTPRLLRVEPGGSTSVVADGENGPWNGVVFHDGAFYVADGGEKNGGRILRIAPDGTISPLVEGLPSLGDHHTNGPAVGPDGWLYFGQGTATNSGVVGTDNYEFGWLKRHPDFHDVPCKDVRLAGRNFSSDNPLSSESGDQATTGAFLPFGTPSTAGQVIAGKVPCSGAVLRVRPAGGAPELVAWGFRNPFALAFAPDGRLYLTENGYDQRGSRPVYGSPDVLWRVEPGAWYGWPDHAMGVSLRDGQFHQGANPPLEPVLEEAPGTPPRPAAMLGVHASANGFDFSRSASFGHTGEAFVALFGDMAPKVGKVLGPVGFKVVRVDPATGREEDFAVNRRDKGPASLVGGGGLERPVATRFDPSGEALYVVDFGVMTVGPQGAGAPAEDRRALEDHPFRRRREEDAMSAKSFWILGCGLLALLPACSARRGEPVAGPLTLDTPELRQGEIAFDRNCSHCHPGGERGLAPAINNKPLPGFMIKTQVRHGAGTMPAFSKEELPPEELDALVKYLKALRRN